MSVPSQHRHFPLIKGVILGLGEQAEDPLGAQGPPFLASLGWGSRREGSSGFRIKESSGLSPGLIV